MLHIVNLLFRNSSLIKVIFAFVFTVISLINIYYTFLLDHFGSSHQYHRQQVIIGKLLNVTRNDTVGKMPLETELDYEIDWNNILHKLHPPIASDYPEYNVTIGHEVRPVPLWQRRQWKKAGYGRKSDHLKDHNDDGQYRFLTELLQVLRGVSLFMQV